MLASSRGFIMLLRSYDAWHIDLSSSYSAEQCSDLEKDSKNFSMYLILEFGEGSWCKYHRNVLRNLYKVHL